MCREGVGFFFSLSPFHFPHGDTASSVFFYHEISLLLSGGKCLNKEHIVKYLVVCALETDFILYTFPSSSTSVGFFKVWLYCDPRDTLLCYNRLTLSVG